MPNAKPKPFRPNSKLTKFLVALLIDETLAKKFADDKAAVIKGRKLSRTIVKAINADDTAGLKVIIGGLQGGGGKGRAKEANRLAKKAASLAKKR
jgi:hypothetical protein